MNGAASDAAEAQPPVVSHDEAVIELAAPPWRSIAAAVVVVYALLYATLSRYGYQRDELYFRMLPLRWGYVDSPPRHLPALC